MDHAIGNISQIPKGEGRNYVVPGPLGEVTVAVFHMRDGGLFACQADCPHKGGPLADGLTDGASVVCPLHDRTYDFATGTGPDCSIRVYPVRTDAEGTILVVAEPTGAVMAAG